MRLPALAFAAVALTAFAAEKPPSGAALIDQAKIDAASGRRAIWVIFHASW